VGRVRAYIGIGSNVGDPVGTMTAAVRALGVLPGVRLVGVSRLYATMPVGVTEQPEFRNAVAALDVSRRSDPAEGARALLAALKRLERSLGRRRRERWGPRELDLDLLVFGRNRIDGERPPAGSSLDLATSVRALVVPHPEAHDRLFVLAPLADLAPGLVPPGWSETVATARRRRERIEGIATVRPVAGWVDGVWEPLATDDQSPS